MEASEIRELTRDLEGREADKVGQHEQFKGAGDFLGRALRLGPHFPQEVATGRHDGLCFRP